MEERATRNYLVVYAVLLGLTAATVGAAYLDLGDFSAAVAVLIAALKATLVVVFFMHLLQTDRSLAVTLSAVAILAVVLLVYSVADVLTRQS